MNLDSIKKGFIEYIEKKSKSQNSEFDPTAIQEDLEGISIFKYAKEFKEYVSEELNLDKDVFSKDIGELLNMVAEDGKLVDEAEDTEKESEEAVPEEDEEDGFSTGDIFTGILNDILSDEDVISAIDTEDENGEKDGVLSEDEVKNFLSYMSGLDEDSDTLSLDDMFEAISEIKNGTYAPVAENSEEAPTVSNEENAADDSSEINQQSAEQAAAPTATSAPRYSGGGGGVQASAPTNSARAADSFEEKDVSDMNLSELQAALAPAKADLSQKEQALEDAYNESGEIASLKEAKDKAYEEYMTSLEGNDELKTKIDDKQKQIDDTQNKISDVDKSIEECNSTYRKADADIQAAEISIQNYESAISKLQSSEDEDKESKLAQLNSLKTQAQEAKSKAEEAKNQALKNKEKKEQEKASLQGSLEGYKKDLTELEASITDSEASSAKDAFKAAEEEYLSVKDKTIRTAKTDLKEAQDYVSEIEKTIAQKQTKKEANSFVQPPLFDEDMEVSIEPVTVGGMECYLIGPKDADPNQELPLVVFLHGNGERGGSATQVASSVHGPAGFMQMDDYNMTGFNGYILCPHLPEAQGSWTTKESDLRNMLDAFEQDHAVGKKVIMGASGGGIGAAYMAEHMGDCFDEAVVISGYRSVANSKIPVRGYYGSADDGTSINIMKNDKNNYDSLECLSYNGATGANYVDHGHVPQALFTMDADNDGCPDILQDLFGED